MNKPLVSIVCDVYNHGPFLRNALEGFIMQQVKFPIEILVHDDASTDNSAEIIREYEAKYPNLFKPIYETENQYHKQHLWADIQFPRAQGKYIALCEGDDYWTDPLKLQKQVDYMEAHPDCSLCFHNAIVLWYNNSVPNEIYASFMTGDFSGPELVQTWISPTASFLFRSSHMPEYFDFYEKHPKLTFGDIPLLMFLSRFGSIHGLSDIMSVYGKHDGGWTHSANAVKIYKDARSWDELQSAFKEYKDITSAMMSKRYLNACKHSLKENNLFLFLKAFYRGFIRHPFMGAKALLSHTESKGRLK